MGKKSSKYNEVGTPIPSKMRDIDMSIIVTPASKTKKNRHKNRSQNNQKQSPAVLMMADLMTPNPNKYELSSPAPFDKNAKLLTQSPANFSIVMPPTPCPNTAKQKRSALEEKWCNEYFERHIPELTPIKKRQNPLKLYDPAKDSNVTQLLESSEAPFDEDLEAQAAKQRNANISCGISTIMQIENSQNQDANNENENAEASLFGNSFALDMNLNSFVSTNSASASVKSFAFSSNSMPSAMFLTPADSTNSKEKMRESVIFDECPLSDISKKESESTPSPKKQKCIKSPTNLLKELDEKLSSIKLEKTKCLSQDIEPDEDIDVDGGNDDDDDEDLLLMSVDPMCDEEFFGGAKTEDQSTQTEHGIFFPENEIPKIRYNGKLLSDLDVMSHSAIFWNEYNEQQQKEQNNLNASITSAQSEKILYSLQSPMYAPTLRHNEHSIELLDDLLCSDSDNSVSNNHKFNQSMPINIGKEKRKKKKKQNGCKMLNEYKRSQLALNPNHTFC